MDYWSNSNYEKNISTKQSATSENTWVPFSNEYQARAGGVKKEKSQGPVSVDSE